MNHHLVYEEESNFENRTRNINSFLHEATKILHGEGCLVSADIFGYVLQSESDNGIGQHLETIVKSVDLYHQWFIRLITQMDRSVINIQTDIPMKLLLLHSAMGCTEGLRLNS